MNLVHTRQFLADFESSLSEGSRKALCDFFLFSRMEYALKKSGYLQGTDKVEANWDKFASAHEGSFSPEQSPQLKEAYEYFHSRPPMKQVRDSAGRLAWKAWQNGSEKPLSTLLILVRRVRNNLFHGGKFPMVPVEEPARNRELIDHATVILETCLQMDEPLRELFLQG